MPIDHLALGKRNVDRVWDPVFEVVGLVGGGCGHGVKVLLLIGHTYLYELYLIFGVFGKNSKCLSISPIPNFYHFSKRNVVVGLDGEAVGRASVAAPSC